MKKHYVVRSGERFWVTTKPKPHDSVIEECENDDIAQEICNEASDSYQEYLEQLSYQD